MLFVLAADFIQTILNTAKQCGILSLPLDLPHDQDFPILQYADDTLIFMQGDARQIFFLKAILNSFADSTGLKVNYAKSMMVPINVFEHKMNILASTFGCSIGSLPFTYLGLPLSITKPTIADFWPLVSKCERMLVTISSFMSQAGRLQMTNVVLSALPTYAMCAYLLPKTVIRQIDKFRTHCLWRGSDPHSKTPQKAAWKLVCNSKENGGLGVHDLYIQNESLLLKHLHKFFNKCDIPWVQLMWNTHYIGDSIPINDRKGSFWWKDIFKLMGKYKDMASVIIGDGSTCLFWSDLWHGPPLNVQCLELFSF